MKFLSFIIGIAIIGLILTFMIPLLLGLAWITAIGLIAYLVCSFIWFAIKEERAGK
jgi:hypothetical protein